MILRRAIGRSCCITARRVLFHGSSGGLLSRTRDRGRAYQPERAEQERVAVTPGTLFWPSKARPFGIFGWQFFSRLGVKASSP